MEGKVIRSLILTTVISSLLAWLTIDEVNAKDFLKWCIIYTIIQVFCNAIYITCVEYFVVKRLNKQVIERYNKQLKTTVTFTCPCPSKILQSVDIDVSKQNSYKCIQCDKEVNVAIDLHNRLATKPVDAIKVNPSKITQELNDKLD